MASLLMLNAGWSRAELLLCPSCSGSAAVEFTPRLDLHPTRAFNEVNFFAVIWTCSRVCWVLPAQL